MQGKQIGPSAAQRQSIRASQLRSSQDTSTQVDGGRQSRSGGTVSQEGNPQGASTRAGQDSPDDTDNEAVQSLASISGAFLAMTGKTSSSAACGGL